MSQDASIESILCKDIVTKSYNRFMTDDFSFVDNFVVTPKNSEEE